MTVINYEQPPTGVIADILRILKEEYKDTLSCAEATGYRHAIALLQPLYDHMKKANPPPKEKRNLLN